MKDAKRVRLQVKIEQVVDGAEYKGTIGLGEVDISYGIVFKKTIPEIVAMTSPPSDLPELRALIQITTSVGDREVPLNDQHYQFFLTLLIDFAGQFYFAAQTRVSNTGILGVAVRGERDGLLPKVKLGMLMSVNITLESDLRDSLSEAFGCKL
jgi:hypothetical protein